LTGKKSNFNYNQGSPALNKDYNFANQVDIEQFNLKGVAVFYYKIANDQPSYDPLYRDFISDPVFDNPIEIRAIPQVDENVAHGMTEIGIGQVAEREGSIYFNISLIEKKLGRPPILGDVVYLRQLNQRFQIYHISKDAYKLSLPLRYLCKIRLYQDSNSSGTDWDNLPLVEPPPNFPGTGATGVSGINVVSGYVWYRGDTGPTGLTGVLAPGNTGMTGATGPTLDIIYQFDTTLSGNPASGFVRLDNATPSLATFVYISEFDIYAVGVDTWIDLLTDKIKIQSLVTPSKFHLFQVAGTFTSTGSPSYDPIPVTWMAGSGTFSNNEPIGVFGTVAGVTGATGPTGPTGIPGGGYLDGGQASSVFGLLSINGGGAV